MVFTIYLLFNNLLTVFTFQENWNIYVELSTGQIYGCDMLISATGVSANSEVFTSNNSFKLGDDEAILVIFGNCALN